SALQGMLDRLHTTTGIHTELRTDATLPALTPDAEVALLRTAQSALGNIRQHSEATMAVLTLIDATDAIRLDIIDDGVGFDPSWLVTVLGARSASVSCGGCVGAGLRGGGGLLVRRASAVCGAALSGYLPVNAAIDTRLATQESA